MTVMKSFDFRRPVLPMLLEEPLDVPLPPALAATLGYTAMPPERYVCFYWTARGRQNAPDLAWYDGTIRGFGDALAWDRICEASAGFDGPWHGLNWVAAVAGKPGHHANVCCWIQASISFTPFLSLRESLWQIVWADRCCKRCPPIDCLTT